MILLGGRGHFWEPFFFGFYAAVVAYQESSIENGLLYIVASLSLFDECTNDCLYLREGSCFPRPRYRVKVTSSLSSKGLHEQFDPVRTTESLLRTHSEKKKTLSAVVYGTTSLKRVSMSGKSSLEMKSLAYQISRLDKTRKTGYLTLEFLHTHFWSAFSGDNVELTSLNRPEGRIFDWLFGPMSIMKEQIESLNLVEKEELSLYKFCLYSGEKWRIKDWQNGGFPPQDEIRRAQLEGLCRRLQGFCLTLSRLPTSRRRICEVVKVLEKEAKRLSNSFSIDGDLEEAA
ncbi:uncharacterized membrane protein At3g27390-like [Actinidia eriantha]|uniref:uncharacterized membrane protein At3g27390-like n=1 Tax=Actinidia eriantha TaxID=165200 RepID=UPI00258DFBDB|nr:uncharacterized membrane protein At3g27390-like [Actinidia eriantha]